MPTSTQAPSAVVMVRPHHFHPNPETAGDNSFQARTHGLDAEDTARRAFAEVTAAAAALEAAGVRVHLFDDRGEHHTPDAVFPNNWFSTHAGGHVAIYPMYAQSRRRERRSDVIELLKAEYRVQDVIDKGLLPLFFGVAKAIPRLPIKAHNAACADAHARSATPSGTRGMTFPSGCPAWGRLQRCSLSQGVSLAAHERLASSPMPGNAIPEK